MFDTRFELYGESVFTSLRSFNGQFVCFALHWRRLFESCSQCFGVLGISFEEFCEKYFPETIIEEWLNEHPNDYFRFTFYMDEEISLKKFKFSIESLKLHISTRPMAEAEELNLLNLALAPYPFSQSYRPVKYGSYARQIEHKKAAMRDGFDDALFYDEQSRHLLELTTANIIFVDKTGVFYTPEGNHFLQGITLKCFRIFAKSENLEFKTFNISESSIQNYEYAFALNAVSLLTYINSIGKHEFSSKNTKLFSSIRKKFISYLERST